MVMINMINSEEDIKKIENSSELLDLRIDSNSKDLVKALGEKLNGCSSLKKLTLRGFNSENIKQLIVENLKELEIYGTKEESNQNPKIGLNGAKAIAENLKNLTYLNLSYHNITDDGAKAIAENLKNLTSLNLSINNITDVGAKAIAENLKNLTSLNLSFNNITDVGAEAIATNLTNLTSLNVYSNQITINGVKKIFNLEKLKVLDIGFNKIDEKNDEFFNDKKFKFDKFMCDQGRGTYLNYIKTDGRRKSKKRQSSKRKSKRRSKKRQSSKRKSKKRQSSNRRKSSKRKKSRK